jgi:hypothetical protein
MDQTVGGNFQRRIGVTIFADGHDVLPATGGTRQSRTFLTA